MKTAAQYRTFFLTLLLFFFCCVNFLFGSSFQHALCFDEQNEAEFVWECAPVKPFRELQLSWNASRGEQEGYSFFVSLRQNGVWSPWLFYGEWGHFGQLLCKEGSESPIAETFRGTARAKQTFSDGFRIRLASPIRGTLFGLRTLFVSTFGSFVTPGSTLNDPSPILLEPTPRFSLFQLRFSTIYEYSHCVAAAAAINYLGKSVDPVDFSNWVYDQDFDCYEHWPLIAAEASERLGPDFEVRVEYLPDFSALYTQLKQGYPVVVGIIGTLTGSPMPYRREHGIVVIGYDPVQKKVQCIDPGFAWTKSTFVSYSLEDFLRAWEKRKNVSCIFKKNSNTGI